MAQIARVRDRKSFRRQPGRKSPRPITLIVCEGETEEAYFAAAKIHFGLTSAEVVIADNRVGSAPINVVSCAERKSREPGGYDKIFCVFDRDCHASFDAAREKIRRLATRKNKPLPIMEIVSIPCFEVWVLLHFERTDAPFSDCTEVVERIRSRHMQDYRKANTLAVGQLMARLSTAKVNAESLESASDSNRYNPYTLVHRVLRHFESVATQRSP